MGSREQILERVRASQPGGVALPALPRFARPAPSLAAFAAALERMGGALVQPTAAEAADLDALIRARFPQARVICSAVPEVRGTRRIADVTHARELDDVDVGVVRARLGVAETGSVWLGDAEFVRPALGFLSQHLVVLLDPARLVADLHDVYREGLGAARYVALMTGPSATADIEGVLIRGAQGIRSLTVVAVA